jgi:hypothetical protein
LKVDKDRFNDNKFCTLGPMLWSRFSPIFGLKIADFLKTTYVIITFYAL